MSLPIISTPPVLSELMSEYSGFFSKPQFRHFQRLVTGLIVSENKTIQEINDQFDKCDQSSLNRFVSHSKWDMEELNIIRLNQVGRYTQKGSNGTLILDESLSHKSGLHMEMAGRHRSGVTKRIEWGHMRVNAFFTDDNNNDFPVRSDVYVREKDVSKSGLLFLTKREIAITQVDYAMKNNLEFDVVLVDAGYDGVVFVRELKKRGKKFVVGVRVSTKISIRRQKRISIENQLDQLTDTDFKQLVDGENIYFYNSSDVSMRGIGKVKLFISYKMGDEKNIKCYITNLDVHDCEIMKRLIKRWRIECFHRDGKQHLGLEAYQVRKARGMQVVALAILIAYTLVFLVARSVKALPRPLKSVGEVCRYLALIAYRGIKWINNKSKNLDKFTHILKKHVYIKSAKV